jgi:hypothetical protein
MIELLISVCLSAGADCRDVSLLYDAHDVSLMSCMVMGQGEAARWQQQHPEWHITRWSCAHADERGKSI